MKPTQNINIKKITPLITPEELLREIPASEKVTGLVVESRNIIRDILDGKDRRFLVIVGPCSIHDDKAALEYAGRLAELHRKYSEQIYVVMRVYFEKPRTTVGWKGLINDPHLNGSYDMLTGLRKGRQILLKVLETGLPTATEFLDPIVPQYIGDLVSWAAIGARTTESQTHRQMASGLSMPVGFKNNTDGNFQVAIDALQSAENPHHFLGIDEHGLTSVVSTTGNGHCHVILRGGQNKPNYDRETIAAVIAQLDKTNTRNKLIIDCSHANSEKLHDRQKVVFESILDQRREGNVNLVGLMVESNLFEGNQKLTDPNQLKYGVSITDACINFETTEELIRGAAEKLAAAAVHA